MAVDTVWNFDGTLAADFGPSSMAFRGNTASLTRFGTTDTFGLPPLIDSTGGENVMAFPAAGRSQGFAVNHQAGSIVGEYTMIWDLLYPASSDIAWRALLQTNAGNSDDADFFVNNSPWGGVGISGQYHGAIRPDEWNRIAVTRDASGEWTKFINGGYVGEQDASNSRFALGPTVHLFADENNETQPGYVSSYRFLDRAMTANELLQLGGAHAGGAATAGEICSDPSITAPGSFTVAILGDTQIYSRSYPRIYEQQTQWLVDNAADRNIEFALHVGDVVDSDTTSQWDNAMAAQSILDGRIGYAVVTGNHDYSDNRAVSQFDRSDRFGPGSRYARQPSLTGFYPAEPNSRMNTYHQFEAGGQKFLVLALEFGPRDDVVSWAETVIDAHADHRAILLTHAYMFDGGMWFDGSVDPDDPQGRTFDQIRDEQVNRVGSTWNPRAYDWATNANDGKALWDRLVKDRENSSLVISGHQFDERDGFPYLLTQGNHGNNVYQLLFDTQDQTNGGDGWIRLLEFAADGMTVTVKSYSPFLGEWSYASDEFFTIRLSPMVAFRSAKSCTIRPPRRVNSANGDHLDRE